MARPTLIVGYGRFGRECLFKLMQWAAARGLLDWEAPGGGEGTRERRVRKLAMLWVPDDQGVDTQVVDTQEEVQESQVIREAWALVEQVRADSLRGRAQMEVQRLLTEDAAGGSSQALGLDLIVLARPTPAITFGRLRTLLEPLVGDLARQEGLRARGQGAHVLQAIQILDLGDTWSREEGAREALVRYAQGWEERYRNRTGSFSRIYLTAADRGVASHRPDQLRVDETVLFLEFLLFSGHREDGELAPMLARSNDAEPPLAAFGIRSFERNSEIARRTAAAYYGVRWLEALLRDEPDRRRTPVQALESWCERALPEPARADDLARAALAPYLERLRALPVGSPTWPDQVASVLRDRSPEPVESDERSVPARVDPRRALRAEIDARLERPVEPVSIPRLNREIRSAIEHLRAAAPPPAANDPLVSERAREVHAAYHDASARLLDLGRSFWMWLAFGAVVAAGLAPILGALSWRMEPWQASLLVVCAALGAVAYGLLVGARGFRYRVARAEGFWLHPTQGRLAAFLADLLAPEGSVGAALIREVKRARNKEREAARVELVGALDQYGHWLGRREAEIRWLRGQLVQFLKRAGIGLDTPVDSVKRLDGWDSAVRAFPNDAGHFRDLVGKNEPNDQNFAQTLRNIRPFARWAQEYSDDFVDPLTMLDRLSGELLRSGASEKADDQPVAEFIERHEQLPTGAGWGEGHAASPKRYAVTHARYSHFGGLQRPGGPTRVDHPNDTQVWLLALDLGVAIDAVERR